MLRCFSILVFSLVTLTEVVCAQQNWNTTQARKWVKSRKWANGSELKLSPSTNYVEFARQYHAGKEYWDKAIAFLTDKARLDTLKPGKYVIDGDNAFAMITEGPEKDFDQSAWESHRKYIDLHYVISGEEKIGAAPVATAAVTRPYDAEHDIANYTADGKYYIATPSEFFLFFPGDAHRPGIKTPGHETDKKLVIKIKYITH